MANMSEMLSMNHASREHRKSKKKLDHLRIEHGENGGHIVEHHFEQMGGPYHEPEKHVFGKGEHHKMLAHVANTLELPEPKKEEDKQESKKTMRAEDDQENHDYDEEDGKGGTPAYA
jgi:hypothetical protein